MKSTRWWPGHWSVVAGEWTIEIHLDMLNHPRLSAGWNDKETGWFGFTYGNGNSDPVLLVERAFTVPRWLQPHVDRYYERREDG